MKNLSVITGSAEETRELGARVGRSVEAGAVIALCGELGTGKTVFVEGLARGLETDKGVLVTSPTFVILHEYPGRVSLYHFDFYRLHSAEEVRNLGYEEYFEADGVCAVEWGDKFPELFGPKTLWVRFSSVGEEGRLIEFSGEAGIIERCLAKEG